MLRVTLRIGGFGQLTSKTQAAAEIYGVVSVVIVRSPMADES
jgi:hypothetical protein